MNKINLLCPYCNEFHEVLLVEEEIQIEFKNENIKYINKEYLCQNTGKRFSDEKLEELNSLAIKDEYRKINNLLTSTQIKTIREKYSLSQSDLALILGWGEVTITRYETKEIQNEKYDNILRKIDENPYVLYDYFEINKDSFDQKKQVKIYKKIINATPSLEQSNSLIEKTLIKKHFSNDSILRGNSDIDLKRILAILKRIIDRGMKLYKTKIGKLLWYMDMLYYKENNYSITGLSYFNMKYGAVPLGLDLILDSPSIKVKEIEENDYVKILIEEVNIDYDLTPKEIKIIDQVINKFIDTPTQEIINAMHKEKAYQDTKENTFISFEYASYVEL